VRDRKLSVASIGSGTEEFGATLKLQDFRHGTIKLNDNIGVRIETGIYRGGGGL